MDNMIEQQKEDKLKYERYLLTFKEDSHVFDPTTMGFQPLSFKELFGYEAVIVDDPITVER